MKRTKVGSSDLQYSVMAALGPACVLLSEPGGPDVPRKSLFPYSRGRRSFVVRARGRRSTEDPPACMPRRPGPRAPAERARRTERWPQDGPGSDRSRTIPEWTHWGRKMESRVSSGFSSRCRLATERTGPRSGVTHGNRRLSGGGAGMRLIVRIRICSLLRRRRNRLRARTAMPVPAGECVDLWLRQSRRHPPFSTAGAGRRGTRGERSFSADPRPAPVWRRVAGPLPRMCRTWRSPYCS